MESEKDRVSFVREFLSYVRRYEPPFPERDRARASQVMGDWVDQSFEEGVQVRRYESALRTSMALPWLRLEPVGASHVHKVMEIITTMSRRQPG